MDLGSGLWLDLEQLPTLGLGSLPLRRMAVRFWLWRLVLFTACDLRILSGRSYSALPAESSCPTAGLSSSDGSFCSQQKQYSGDCAHAPAGCQGQDSFESGTRNSFAHGV